MSHIDHLKAASRTKHLNVRRNEQVPYQSHFIIPREFVRLDPWEIQYLYALSENVSEGIVEVGRYKGGSTLLFSLANTKVPIHSIDNAPQDDDYLRTLMHTLGVGKNVNIIVGDSQNTKYSSIGNYDLLFIDGDHSYQGCLNDLNNWWEQLSRGGHLVCHDCYYLPVQNAVHDFINSPHVKESVLIHVTYKVPAKHKLIPTGSLCHFQKI